jgi:glycosyltransferase involved in cell wall biosynthesis
MRILHICNDYINSDVYKLQYKKFAERGFYQQVFHPLRRVNKNLAKNIPSDEFVQIQFSRILQIKHKFFFRLKIKFLYKDLKKQVNLKNEKPELTIATTLYSDGALAFKLFKDYGIPYIICVRHTDINFFKKYRKDLTFLEYKIISNAKHIVFISNAIATKFINTFPWKLKKIDYSVIPNGIDQFWFENKNDINNSSSNKFLFIGKFDDNKNLIKLIKGINIAKRKHHKITLTCVGSKSKASKELKSLLIKHSSWISIIPYTRDKNTLLQIYRSNKNFVMYSHHETFGLVYLEALTQGLNIGYSINQGVFGMFPDFDRFAANSRNIQDISEKIMLLKKNNIKNNASTELFTWDNNVNSYIREIKKIRTVFD